MYPFRAHPFLRLLPPFALGIGIADYFPFPFHPAYAYAALLAVCLAAWMAQVKYVYSKRWLFGGALVLLLAGIGSLRARFDDELRHAAHFAHLEQPGQYWTAVLTDAPVPGKRLKTPVQLLTNSHNLHEQTTVSGNAILFISRNDSIDGLRYGDTLLFQGALQPTKPPGNPHAFDYARYLHHKDVHHLAYVHADSVLVLGRNGGSPVWRLAFGQRSRLLDMLERYFPDAASQAVASALLVGYKEELPDDLEQAYINTGSMHALAVSGTHVGFVYAGLYLLFRQFRLRGRAQRLVETLGVLLGVWAFTLLAGASASVLRAAWMFSLFLMGRAMFRMGSVWNTLAASAFVLLWADPDYLFDAGFQLSYAAVAGMVFFYPMLYKQVPPLPRVADEAMKVLLVGVAAQLGTLPLSLFYFHQFPVYFWLAGWVVVLGGALFLWGGVALVVLDVLWPWGALWLGKALYGLVWVMNVSVSSIQHLPGSMIDGIWYPGWVGWLLYGAMALLSTALLWSGKRPLLAALGLLALLAAVRMGREQNRLNQHELIVYQAGYGDLMDVVSGRKRYTLADSMPLKQEKFAAQMHRWALGVRHSTVLPADSAVFVQGISWTPPLLLLPHEQVLVMDDRFSSDMLHLLPPASVWWVCDRPDVDLESLPPQTLPKTIIIGGSVRRKAADQWENFALQHHIICHRVARDGAWQMAW